MSKNREIEVRLLKVDVDEVTKKLLDAGAKKINDLSFERHIFDVVPEDGSQWLRLRTDGKVTTLTYKHRLSDDIDGTEEIEVRTDDIDKTLLLLDRLGYRPKSTQENRRSLFMLDGTEVTIDTWPDMPPYMEIEAESSEKINALIERIGLDKYEKTTKTVEQLYLDMGIDIKKLATLKF